MRVAEILSDLTSLRVCDHQSALALVSCHKALGATNSTSISAESSIKASQQAPPPTADNPSTSTRPRPIKKSSSIAGADGDPDLQRAMDLVDLHYGVKMQHVDGGVGRDLERARRDVEEVVATMEGGGQGTGRGRG